MYPMPKQKAQPNRADSPQQAFTIRRQRVQHAGGSENLEERETRRAVRLDGVD